MKCKSCGKIAKSYTLTRNGTEITVELCESCYKRLYGDDGFSDETPIKKECPACGTTYEEFRRSGLVGCAECYNAFRAEIIPMLGYLQRSAHHVGKVPVEAGEAYDNLRELIVQQGMLREELEQAERNRDGVRAVQLRMRLDEIGRKLRRQDT